MIFISDIQRCVADEYRVSPAVMRTPSVRGQGKWAHSHPRQVAMALSASLTSHSLARIGYFFGGRDHTTVMHAIRAVGVRVQGGDQRAGNLMRRITLDFIRGS